MALRKIKGCGRELYSPDSMGLPFGDLMRDDDALENFIRQRHYNYELAKELRKGGKRMSKHKYVVWKKSIMDMEDDHPLREYI